MRFIGVIALLFIASASSAQAVNSVNYNYFYNLQGEVYMGLHPVVRGDSVVLYWKLETTNNPATTYVIQWEKKDSYSQRQGGVLSVHDTVALNAGVGTGKFTFIKPEKPWVLVAKVTNPTTAKSWLFFRQIEAHFPVNGYLEKNGIKQWLPYIPGDGKYTVTGSGSGKPIHFSFYKDNFPTPTPPFAEKELKMDRFLFPDSTFSAVPGSAIGPFNKEGLYLAQEDTLSSEGFSFMVKKSPYPKYNKLGELKGPLLFVTTREENDKLGDAGEDKAKFDKIILDITNDKERAKNFMRNFFKRVEIANLFFTSFKEGWKTDRGMIFIVFGAPDEIGVNGQQEIWAYKSPRQTFIFTKAGSVYNPDHYVLIRDSKYTEDWYLTIDLWRKSRF
jgi:GWxTD domain-containing protein